MKRFSFRGLVGPLALATLSLAGCKKDIPADATGTFTLEMQHVVGSAPLDLSAATYQNANGDDFTVSTFKYYLSNIRLRRADNSTYLVPESYFLVDQAKAETRVLRLSGVPVGDYTGIGFTVGIDSARTKEGRFTGVLNANNGMFWDMNGPEFINLKLEGTSPQARTGGLIFHIAGYKQSTTNTIRTVMLPLPGGGLPIRADRSPQLYAKANVLKLFTGPHQIDFSRIYNTMGGPNATKVADNLAAGLFSIDRVVSQ